MAHSPFKAHKQEVREKLQRLDKEKYQYSKSPKRNKVVTKARMTIKNEDGRKDNNIPMRSEQHFPSLL